MELTTRVNVPAIVMPGNVGLSDKIDRGNERSRATVSSALLASVNNREDRNDILSGAKPDSATGRFIDTTLVTSDTKESKKSEDQLRIEKAIKQYPDDSLEKNIERAGFDITTFGQHNAKLYEIMEKFAIELQNNASAMQIQGAKISADIIKTVEKAGQISVAAAKTNAANVISMSGVNIAMSVTSSGMSTVKTNKVNRQMSNNNNKLAGIDMEKSKLNNNMNDVLNRKGVADAASRKHVSDAMNKTGDLDIQSAELRDINNRLQNSHTNTMNNIVTARTAVTAGTQGMGAVLNVDVVKQEQDAKHHDALSHLQESLQRNTSATEQRTSEMQRSIAENVKKIMEADQQNQKGNIGRM